MAMELEKQKTHWNIEQDRLLSLKMEAQEDLERSVRTIDTLQRENDKLRHEIKIVRRSMVKDSIMLGSKGANKSDIFSMDKSDVPNKAYILGELKTSNGTPPTDSH